MRRLLEPTPRAIHALPIGITLAIITAGAALAADKCKMRWDTTPAGDTKYTQRQVLDAGDVAGHQTRFYEFHRVYSNDRPNCEGLKRVETWVRGYADLIDLSGPTWGYAVTTLEGGDKIFSKWSGISLTVVTPDGSNATTTESTALWTGGTGKYLGIRGVEVDHTTSDVDKGLNQYSGEVEYWFDK